MDAETLRQAFEGHGPLVEAMLAERARALARPMVADDSAPSGLHLLRLQGASGSWAVPITAVARVESLPDWLPVPGQTAAVLGLALLGGRRCLLADAEVVVAAAPPRPRGRPGHAVLLRDHALAFAVDRADGVMCLPAPPAGRHLLADGSVLMMPDRLLAAVLDGGAR